MRISDWSSDVCSSDLEDPEKRTREHHALDRDDQGPASLGDVLPRSRERQGCCEADGTREDDRYVVHAAAPIRAGSSWLSASLRASRKACRRSHRKRTAGGSRAARTSKG